MRVEAYQEEREAGPSPVVDGEAKALIEDETTKLDTSHLLGWLKAVRSGNAAPKAEPDAPRVNGHDLKYRCVGNAVVIFAIVGDPAILLVLLFARSASGYPRVDDLIEANERMERWSPGDEKA